MKVYISGKISGIPHTDVIEKFRQAEQQIIGYGHQPINPLNNGIDVSESWNKHMAADIAMLLECDAIYLLADWSDSVGARIEAHIAAEIGIDIMHQPDYGTYKSRM